MNTGKTSISFESVIVDGQPAEEVKIGGKIYSVRKMITEDLRAIKKKNMDKDGKKQINGKDEQKNILNGRSPDFSDSLSIRCFLDLSVQPTPNLRWI